MQLNILDRAIAAVAPAWAADRKLARARMDLMGALDGLLPQTSTSASMDGATSTTHHPASAPSGSAGRWWRPLARDARADTMHLLPGQRGASRELVRTSPIAAGAINTNVDRVVGTGLALSAQPNRAVLGWSLEQALEWKAITQREFSLWADSPECDIEGLLNFFQMQSLTLRSTLESGDAFTLLPDGERTATQPYALRLQLLEADRAGNPNGLPDTATVAGGIRLGPNGAAQAAYIYDQHPGGWQAGTGTGLYKGQWVDFVGQSGRRRLLHHYRKLRPGMLRGVPYLAPIVDCIKQISRYTEAEIMAAVITSYLTVFIETPGGSSAPIFDGVAPEGGAPAEVGLGMGAVVGLAPGEKATTVNPARPNPNFEPFLLGVMTQIGMALGIPRELLIKQFTSSYSASKAALLDAWVYFRNVRQWLALSFCQPVYETWLAEAVAIGRIKAPGFFSDPLMRWAYTRAAWPGDSMGSINPKDEVAAYVAAIDARLMTRERAEWELWGTDFNETFDQKQGEQERLRRANLLPTPKAGAAAPQDVPGEPSEPDNEGRQDLEDSNA